MTSHSQLGTFYSGPSPTRFWFSRSLALRYTRLETTPDVIFSVKKFIDVYWTTARCLVLHCLRSPWTCGSRRRWPYSLRCMDACRKTARYALGALPTFPCTSWSWGCVVQYMTPAAFICDRHGYLIDSRVRDGQVMAWRLQFTRMRDQLHKSYPSCP